MWGRNCSEFVASGGTFVLTLNRASALKVEGREQNFLLRQHIVATMLVLTYNFHLPSRKPLPSHYFTCN